MTLRINLLQILTLFFIKPEIKKKKTTLRKHPLQILILFFIKPEKIKRKKNDAKEKFVGHKCFGMDFYN